MNIQGRYIFKKAALITIGFILNHFLLFIRVELHWFKTYSVRISYDPNALRAHEK